MFILIRVQQDVDNVHTAVLCDHLWATGKKKNRPFAHKDKMKTEQTRKLALGLTGLSESNCAGHVSAGVTDRYRTRITDYDTTICVAICGMRLDQLIAVFIHFVAS